jgi:N-acetylglucosaminyldiphosphoundecaprenol N-acetyl-beta-D-mannosaminyltransferase
MKKLNVSIFQGVGGSFDVVSGNLKRAPKWMQKIGLEWLYRVLIEPKRIVRIIKLVKFLARNK